MSALYVHVNICKYLCLGIIELLRFAAKEATFHLCALRACPSGKIGVKESQ
jgi:hypothetical protein